MMITRVVGRKLSSVGAKMKVGGLPNPSGIEDADPFGLPNPSGWLKVLSDWLPNP